MNHKRKPHYQRTEAENREAMKYGICPECHRSRGLIAVRDDRGRTIETIIGCWNTECQRVGT